MRLREMAAVTILLALAGIAKLSRTLTSRREGRDALAPLRGSLPKLAGLCQWNFGGDPFLWLYPFQTQYLSLHQEGSEHRGCESG